MTQVDGQPGSAVHLEVPAGAALLRGVFVAEERRESKEGFSFGDVVGLLRDTWPYVLAGLLLGVGIGIAVGLLSVPRWKAETVIMSRSDSQASAMSRALLSQLGGLASIAGLESSDDASRQHALALMKSKEFMAQFIRDHGAMPVLFPERWDAQANAWLKDASEPTIRQAIKRFNAQVLGIADDKKTGLITISMKLGDRELAAKWANAFVAQANESLRRKAKDEADTNLGYLMTALRNTPEVSTRQAIYSLIEAQHRSLMLATTTREFAFRVVDPATVPDAGEKIWPPRTSLAIFGAVGGTIAGLLAGLLVVSVRRRKSAEPHGVPPVAQP